MTSRATLPSQQRNLSASALVKLRVCVSNARPWFSFQRAVPPRSFWRTSLCRRLAYRGAGGGHHAPATRGVLSPQLFTGQRTADRGRRFFRGRHVRADRKSIRQLASSGPWRADFGRAAAQCWPQSSSGAFTRQRADPGAPGQFGHHPPRSGLVPARSGKFDLWWRIPFEAGHQYPRTKGLHLQPAQRCAVASPTRLLQRARGGAQRSDGRHADRNVL